MRIYVNTYPHSKKSMFAVCSCLVINKNKLPFISKLNPALIRGGRRFDAASGRTTTIPFTIVLVRSTGVSRELTPIDYSHTVEFTKPSRLWVLTLDEVRSFLSLRAGVLVFSPILASGVRPMSALS